MASSIRNRRTFLRRTAALGSAAAVGVLTGCLGDGPALDPADTDDRSDPVADPMDLHPEMEIGVGFTGFGGVATPSEVDPDEPDGGTLVTVDAVEPGEEVRVSWRRTVEREVTAADPSTVGVGEETPTPRVETVEETGAITATGLADAHAAFLPMFWEPGETTTGTSAMWLSREAFRELKETRQTDWSADALTRITWVGKAVQERIHSAVENVDEDEVVLEAEADFVDFELAVDGRRTAVEAITAHDSFGNEYVVVANEANPLVAKFTYNAVSAGVTGFDTALWSLIKAVFSGYQVVSVNAPR